VSYKLNKTDGSLLVDLVDGSLDTTSTDISLIGKNYSGFGESINENFIKILENFANTSAPSLPLKGQLWFDSTESRLKVYDGTNFRTSGGPIVQNSQPGVGVVAGDLWINNATKQLHFYDGTNFNLAGPIYTNDQGKSGFETLTILDTQNNSKTIVKFSIGGTLIGVFSNNEFTPAAAYAITGLANIKKGFNIISTVTDFVFRGSADSAAALVDNAGVAKSASQFLSADSNSVTTGTVTVANSGGITIGTAQNNIQKVVGTSVVNENQLSNHDYKIRVRKATGFVDAITIDTSESFLGIFKDTPQHTLHVGGDMRVDGNLFLTSPAVNIETQNLRVEDKNIELGITSDSTSLDNAGVDFGGIILKSSDLDKEWVWRNATGAWTSSENIDVVATKWYKAEGVNVLNKTELGSTVTQALGLTDIGTLNQLNVDQTNIQGAKITTSTPLQLESTGSITITNNQKITGLAEPTTNTDAATKFYVDDQINLEPVVMSLDITGLSNSNISTIIEDIYPASNKKTGTYAYIATSTIAGATVTGIDVDAAKNISYVAVDANGVLNQSVVQDVAFASASGGVNVTISRGLKRFRVAAGAWVFDNDLGSSGGLW
jgi:hypothetical protein|tara:strand:- start:2792 stop:4603 length:1812 start_codon:yes stop_codon:yes gene_type:complete